MDQQTLAQRETAAIKRTPLPKLQLLVIFLVQIVEPITATVVLPFVNQFVRDITGGNERKTGYYAGLIGTAFFLSESLVVFHWGWLSDRVGRRPVLLLGPIGVSLAMISFGASSHFWMLVATRCAQGVFNGNIGVSKTVIAEITDSTNLADAYAMMPLTWTLGSTVGPVLGGILAEPAKRWPSFFGKISYFTDRPYFLPCAATGFFALMVAFVAFIGLKETLPSVVERRREYMIPSQSTALVGQNAPNYRSTGVPQIDPTRKAVMEAPVPFKGLLIPQVLTPLLVYTTLAFINISLHVLLPLMYSTSIAVGGLGFDAYRIGVIMGIFGCATACVQFFLLAKLVRRFGPRNVVALAQLSYVVNIAFYPALNFFARRAGKVDGTVWAIVVAQLVSRLPAGMGWGSIQIIIVDSAPNKASLGATNGMGQAAGCFARSIGPSVASSLFSFSLERNLMGGNLVYLVLMGFALIGLRLTFLLPQKLSTRILS